MNGLIAALLSYDFLQRALIVGLLVSMCAALLGVSLVLKRYSMIGDGLSHVGFGALAIAAAMNAAPLAVSIPVLVFCAVLMLRVSESSKIKGDAIIALMSTGSLAIGIIVISMSSGMNTDVNSYLFGSVLALSESDVVLSLVLAGAVLIIFVLFYNTIFAVTFDENFARSGGVRVGLYNTMISVLTALAIVLGMRLMGALLISCLIICPALTSMRVFDRFKAVTICAAIVSVICFVVGVVCSFAFSVPTGASIVIANLAAFMIFWLVSKFKGAGLKAQPKTHRGMKSTEE